MSTLLTTALLGGALMLPLAPVPAAPAAPAGAAQTRADRARASKHYQSGLRLYRDEAFEEAAREFGKAISLDSEYEMAYYELGRSLVALKRYVEAIDAYRTSRKLFEQSVSDRYANQQERRQRLQDQLREIDEMIRQSQQGPVTLQSQNRARQLEDMQRRIRDNMDREHGTALDTTVPAFLSLALGSAHFRAQQLPEAEAEYKACLAADPQAGEAWNNLAVIYMLTGRLPEAERAVEAAEKTGYKVNQGLKDEIAKRKKG